MLLDRSRRLYWDLEAFGVTETIFSEREVAYRLAHRLPSKTVMAYIPLARGHSIQELAIPDEWLGRSLRQLGLPRRYGIQVVAIVVGADEKIAALVE